MSFVLHVRVSVTLFCVSQRRPALLILYPILVISRHLPAVVRHGADATIFHRPYLLILYPILVISRHLPAVVWHGADATIFHRPYPSLHGHGGC